MVSIGHSLNARLAEAMSSRTADDSTLGTACPPNSGSAPSAGQPPSTYCSIRRLEPLGGRHPIGAPVRAFLVAALVQRLEHFFREAGGFAQHLFRELRRIVFEPAQCRRGAASPAARPARIAAPSGVPDTSIDLKFGGSRRLVYECARAGTMLAARKSTKRCTRGSAPSDAG